ncbi:MAG: transglycosylase SLT domain-containing protein, partial [Chloroflexi bacterium]|nr:transglycosylase SLT domain-containing protein [Chloroflexota bacterium]
LYPDANDASAALDRLSEAKIVIADYQRGLVYFYAGKYPEALKAFAADLKANPSHASALYFTALTQRASGDAPAAVTTFEDFIARYPDDEKWADAWFDLAWTHREYRNSFEDAIATYRKFAETAPTPKRAPEALFLAARLAERLNDLALAAQLWGSIPAKYPDADNAPDAAFQAGIVLYRAGNFAIAAQTFAAIPAMPKATAERRAAALLWLGKTRARLGDNAGRDAAWAEASQTDPNGYYSIRAAELAAGNMALFAPPPGDDFTFNEPGERAEAEAWLAGKLHITNNGHLGDLSPSILSDGRWARGLELWRLGLYSEARVEFESLRQDYENDALASYQLGLAFRQMRLYRSSASAIRRCLDLVVPDRLAAPKYFTRLRFGAYFTDLIVPVARHYGLDPIFLLSIIRQESAFEPFAGSSAGAQGLMQIIPGTGADIAARLGWPNYQSDDLNRPIVSLNFGTYYLSQKLSDFDGDKFAALAAYNSGSGNAGAWKQIAPDDPDLFLEVIRIEETETYLRFIYEIYAIYERLYGK